MIRLVTAAVLLPALWAAIKLAPPAVFEIAVLLVASIAGLECYGLLAEARPFRWLGLAAGGGLVWSFAQTPPRFEPELPLVLLVLLSLGLAMWRRPEPPDMLRSSVSTVFPVLFVALTLAYLVALRGTAGEDGEDLLLLLFCCVIACDTAAYYAGSTLGRHRMAPRLSPKKSWEGAAAGLVASVLAALLAQLWFYRRLPVAHAVMLGLVLGVAGMAGDLAESMLKRAAGVKDASGLLPGHGGMLDRTDSLLFASPILYYYYRAFLQPG